MYNVGSCVGGMKDSLRRIGIAVIGEEMNKLIRIRINKKLIKNYLVISLII